MRRSTLCLALLVVAIGSPRGAAQSPTRYVGRLVQGQPLAGAALADWHAPDAHPRLDHQPLFDPQNPFRWIRDRALPLAGSPPAFVETHTGDRLPGTVLRHVGEAIASFDGTPPHFLIEPQIELKAPRPYFPATVRVAGDAVRRIVWRRRAVERFEPGVAYFRDGRTVRFRAVRFDDTSAVLLREDGQAAARFDELAELHFPARDPWDAYFDELAVLCPQGESRLLQVETTDGLIATASRERCYPLAEGGAGDAQRWLHGIQPAWSLDMLWVPHRNIVVRRSFAAHEVPLSRLTPNSTPTPSPLRGRSGQVAVNRNAEGGTLESGGQEYGWGFGTQGGSTLRFPLSEGVAGLQGRVGLDRIAGAGGAVQARIFLDALEGSPLWQSSPLVGAGATADWGRLAVPDAPGKRRELVLQIDPLLHNAPPGADPFDIRDLADWLDPLLLLDPQRVQREIARRIPRRIFAWRGWTTEGAGDEALSWRNEFDFPRQFTGMRLGVAALDRPLRLSQPWTPSGAERWLVVVAEHPPNAPRRAKLQVRAAGEPVTEWEVPAYSSDPAQQQVLVVPLSRFQNAGRDVLLEVLQSPTEKEAPVLWKEARIADFAPTLFPVLEDDGDLAAAADSAPESWAWEESQRHSGSRSVRVAGGSRVTLRLPREAAIRERPALGEFRYLRFAYRKEGKGRIAVELHRTQGESPPVRYDAGQGEPSYGSAARVWSLELPDQWIVATRDLYQDFGRSDVVAFTLSVPDGHQALFDHVYLARTERDFEAIPAVPSPDATNREARRELARHILDRVLPATVAIDYGGRYSTGVLVSREGDVLTAGHAVIGPGQEATVSLRDGRRLKATTRGVARDLDLGLLRIAEPGEWPIVEFGDARDLPRDQLYLGVAHRRIVQTEEPPAAHIVGLERVLQGVAWTDFDVSDWSAGGPLVNRDARLVGIQRGRSQFGGFLYTQLLDAHGVLGRLRNGEVWGVWPAGCGPMMGVHLETASGGCRVTEVYAKTPAEAAGLRVGDLIAKIDGRPVRHLDDIYARLGETDPGQQVSLELRRGSEVVAVTAPLIARTP